MTTRKKPSTVASDTASTHGDDTSAVASIDDAIADVRANAGERGLTPQQARAVEKLQTARQLLTGRQTRSVADGR